jgi:hypothetical protein
MENGMDERISHKKGTHKCSGRELGERNCNLLFICAGQREDTNDFSCAIS